MVNLPLEYKKHTNGIHEFVFHEASRQAIDSFYVKLRELAMNAVKERRTLLLIDTRRSGRQPMSYFNARMHRFASQFPQRAPSRIAFIHDHSANMAAISGFARTMRLNDDLWLFPDDKYDEATEWLLEGLED